MGVSCQTKFTAVLKSLVFFLAPFLANCEWSTWSSKEPCSKSCNGGKLLETRHKDNNGGPCFGFVNRYKDCNTQSCPSKFQQLFIYVHGVPG